MDSVGNSNLEAVCRDPPFATRASGKERENVSPSGFLAASGCRPTGREAFPEFNDSSPNLRAPLQESNRRVLNFFFSFGQLRPPFPVDNWTYPRTREDHRCQPVMFVWLPSCHAATGDSVVWLSIGCSLYIGTGRVRNTESS